MDNKNIENLTCGFVSGLTKVCMVHPFDFIRYRIQTNADKNANLRSTLRGILKNEKLSVIGKGFSTTSISVFSMSFSHFSVYSYFLDAFRPGILKDKAKFADPIAYHKENGSKAGSINDFYYLYAAAGAAAGAVLAVVTTPLDNIRIRLQSTENIAGDKEYKVAKPRQAIFNLYDRIGLRGFTRALHISCFREGLASTFYFFAFNYLKFEYLIKNNLDSLPIHISLLIGGTIGVGVWTFTLPIDTVKTKVISRTLIEDKPYKIADCIRDVAKTQGIAKLYKGYSLMVTRGFIVNAFVYTAFDRCKGFFKSKQ